MNNLRNVTRITANDLIENGQILYAKLISMVVLGTASFILGILPIKLSKYVNVKNVDGDKNLLISLLLCFGGGVLLFTTFIHLQPEVRESFDILSDRNEISELPGNLPVSELVFCLGFFFVYFIEEFVHLILHRRKINDNDVLHRSLSVRCQNHYNVAEKKDAEIAIPRVTLNKFDDSGSLSCITNSNKNLLNSHSTIDLNQKSEHLHFHAAADLKNSFSGLLAVLALSFHAIFEGLAVGLEKNEEKVWYLFLAIATHKLVIAFCVGVELVTSETKAILTVFYIGTFSIVTPIGIGAGLLLSENSNGVDITSVILQGMAAGTLLYVVFFEVLARERNNKHSGFYQLLAIILGFCLMASLQILTGHHHDHNHSSPHIHEHDHNHHHHILKKLT